MLKDKRVPDADKAFIKNMLTKPWNLYIFRHSSLTDKSQILSESVLRDHAGWTMSSTMPQIYIHLRGESSKILLQKRGIIKKEDGEASTALGYKVCPNCTEPNKRDSKFCAKCKMILSYNALGETLEYNKKKESELALMKIKYNEDLQSMREEIKHELKMQMSVLFKSIKPEILEQGINLS